MQLFPLLPAWCASLRAAGRSERTIRSYRDAVKALLNKLPVDADVTQITHQVIRSHQRAIGQKNSPKTVSLALTSIRSFCRFLIDSEYRTDDPTLRITFPKLPRRLPSRALSREQVRILMDAIKQPKGLTPAQAAYWARNRLVVLLLLYTGIRRAEAANLRWQDVDLEHGTLTVRSGKGDKDRTVPIHPVALEAVRLAASGSGIRPSWAVVGRLDGTPLTPKGLAHVFDRWIERLELGFPVTAHMLRHTFCTGLIRGGAALFDTQELMGHEDPKTTRRYYQLVGEHLRQAINLLPVF